MIWGIIVGLGSLAVLMILGNEYNRHRRMKIARWHAEDMVALNKQLFGKSDKSVNRKSE